MEAGELVAWFQIGNPGALVVLEIDGRVCFGLSVHVWFPFVVVSWREAAGWRRCWPGNGRRSPNRGRLRARSGRIGCRVGGWTYLGAGGYLRLTPGEIQDPGIELVVDGTRDLDLAEIRMSRVEEIVPLPGCDGARHGEDR